MNNISSYELNSIINPSSWQKQLSNLKDSSLNIDSKTNAQAQDIFDCGFMLLICAVGGLEFFGSPEFTEKLKIFIDNSNQKPNERSKYCCIIHNQDLILTIKLPNSNADEINKVNEASKNKEKHISILDFLTSNKFSTEFVNFLCSCLKFDVFERGTIKNLLNHPFLINNKENKGTGISLPELLKISLQWTKSYILPLEYQSASEKQLDRVIEALNVVLPTCEKLNGGNNIALKDYAILENLNSGSLVIQELAQNLGLHCTKVWKKIEELIKQLNKHALCSIISDSKLYGI